MTLSFNDYLQAFGQQKPEVFTDIGRGIEREALRVLKEGKLSEHPHYDALGSALTHPSITTDYSETLLEFITPVSHSPETAIAQLEDVQKYTLSHINGELLWPMSMPCFVNDEDQIPLAQYGTSNVGTMKTVYRQGLKNRYGSMMQVIAGIHFNFSFPKSFWQFKQSLEQNEQSLTDYISDGYFALIRNYKRYCWLIPYLYGSSPALCRSFLQNKPVDLPFETSDTGYLYLPYATSLRMSDLGYTNSEQSSLRICYNNLDEYVSGVRDAISLSSDKFAEIGVKVDGKYKQLNANVLQIENELYAPIRPKQIAKSGEKPSYALERRGVEYIEVRALDVNPFSSTGIDIQQVRFLDVFLTFCALEDSPELACGCQEYYERNMDEVVLRGRDPQLLLQDAGQQKSVKVWGNELFEKFTKVAELLDQASGGNTYQQAVATELEKINDAEKTPSARIINLINEQGSGLTDFALNSAQAYRDALIAQDYQAFDQAYFEKQTQLSKQEQAAIEASDDVDFDTFLANYFAS